MTCRILVVDDSATIQKIFKISLSRHAAEVVVTASFAEALNESHKQLADLLVVDAHLPGINGPNDLLRLKREHNDAPVLLLIGSHENFDEQAFALAGFTQHLRKPFESQDIIRSVALVLGHELPLKTQDAPQEERVSHASQTRPRISLPISDIGSTAFEHELQTESRLSMPMPSQPSDFLVPPPPPPPPGARGIEVDEARRGRKAFEDPPTMSTGVGFSSASDDLPDTLVEDAPKHIRDAWQDVQHDFKEETRRAEVKIEELKVKLEDFLRGEAPVIVRKAVERYCEAHFAELARSVLTSELRRLAEEKARLLSN